MKYKVSKNGKVLGDFDISAIHRMIDAESLSRSDYYWDEEARSWLHLEILINSVNTDASKDSLISAASSLGKVVLSANSSLSVKLSSGGMINGNRQQTYGR
jgi:hypothetical protein